VADNVLEQRIASVFTVEVFGYPALLFEMKTFNNFYRPI
jgi:hypothetical protein